MTLQDYLNALPRDPNNAPSGATLQWEEDAWPPDLEADLPLGYPYAVIQGVSESDERVFQNGSRVTTRFVDVRLYQKPAADATRPSRAIITAVFYKLLKSPDTVTAAALNETFEGLQLDTFRIPPQEDPNRPGGLMALVRFRLHIRY